MAAAALNLSLFELMVFGTDCGGLFWGFAAAAVAILGFGFSCLWVYRRQHLLEKEFALAMQERELVN